MNTKFEFAPNGDIYGSYTYYNNIILEKYIGDTQEKTDAKTLGDFTKLLMERYNKEIKEDGWVVYNDELITLKEYKEMTK